MKGKVWLIGAGPGDAELLTLKAVRALREADVALVDDLVNPEALQFLRSGTRILKVGKRGWKGRCGRSTPQVFIEKQMVRLARQGLTVARIKGGDPFVFGRGGEEMLALETAGIEVEVASGITAGIGVPAALGIPVTHREYSHGVTLVTGHARDGAPPDWHALARTGTTLVIYMGMGNLPAIAAGLCDAGMGRDTPVAVVQSGTLANQRSVVTTLGGVNGAVEAARIGSPAIVVVGEVVRFARGTVAAMPARQVA
jgi:uroporphyrin-III C-methyltransferase